MQSGVCAAPGHSHGVTGPSSWRGQGLGGWAPEGEQLCALSSSTSELLEYFYPDADFHSPSDWPGHGSQRPKSKHAIYSESSFTGAFPFEIPHPSSPWKPREPGETAPPGPNIGALKRAGLGGERGWKGPVFFSGHVPAWKEHGGNHSSCGSGSARWAWCLQLLVLGKVESGCSAWGMEGLGVVGWGKGGRWGEMGEMGGWMEGWRDG